MGDSRTSATVTVPWSWQVRAVCRRLDPSAFFPAENEHRRTRTRREERAKRVCATCPVRRQCASHALHVREPHGVWGGLTEAERQKILRDRAVARTRR